MDGVIDVVLGDILDGDTDLCPQFAVDLGRRSDNETAGGGTRAQDRPDHGELFGAKSDYCAGEVLIGGLFDGGRVLVLGLDSDGDGADNEDVKNHVAEHFTIVCRKISNPSRWIN